MKASKLARRGAGLAVATALAAAGGLATAGSAFAADQLDVGINQYNLTLPALVNGASVTKTLQVDIYHDQQEKVGTANVVVNATGLGRIAQVTWPAGCTHVGDVGTCAHVHINTLGGANPTVAYLNIDLKALPGVRSGQGTIEVTASTPGMASQSASAPVSVAEGTDLVANPMRWLKGVRVGSTVQDPVSWTNTGDETAPASRVTLQTMPGLSFKQHLKGCSYSANGLTAVCTFNTALKPGQTLKFLAPVALNVTKEAWYDVMAVSVSPLGSGRAKAPVDLNTNDSYSELDVNAVNTAHFAAVGATVHGKAGQTIPVTIGMHSTGPAFIYDRSGGEQVGDIEVQFPAGTTVVKVPQDCFLLQGPEASATAAHYDCGIPFDVAPGQQTLYTFSMRVDKVIPDAKGKVWLDNELSYITGKPVSYPWDPSSVGHTAAVVLNP